MDDLESDGYASPASREIIIVARPPSGTPFVVELTAELTRAATNARRLQLLLADPARAADVSTWAAAARDDEARIVELLARLDAIHDRASES